MSEHLNFYNDPLIVDSIGNEFLTRPGGSGADDDLAEMRKKYKMMKERGGDGESLGCYAIDCNPHKSSFRLRMNSLC